ncbi:hypothetical protein GIB67_039044, partial [Kingdonia uniflora]
ILVCKILNEIWAASGSESRITAKDFLEYYAVKYVTTTDGAYLSSSSSRPCFFDLSSAGRVQNENLLWVSGECLQQSDEEPLELNNRTIIRGISCKVSRKEFFIDFVAKESTELEVALKKLGINRFKRVASKDDKLAQLNEMPDGPVDMATMSSTVVRNLAKRKAMKRGATSRSATSDSVNDNSKRRKVTPTTKSQVVLEESAKIAEGADLRPRFEFARALRGVQLGLQDRSIELERKIPQLEGEKNQFEESLTREREAFQLELDKEREIAALKLKEVRAESVVEAERLVSVSATSQNNLTGKLYQLRYTKAEILAFSEGNYEKKEIVDEEEVEEMEDGLNVAEKTVADNQETIDQFRMFVYVHSTREDAELAEYRIRALNEEIFDMKCNIRILNKQLLKREIDLDTARTNLAVSEANFGKLSSRIGDKDLELRNSAQIRDSLIARLDRLKADLRHLKERGAKSRANLAEVQAKNKNLEDNLAHVRRNVRRAMQGDKEMNVRINQLCARITELERELRAREMKYEKDLCRNKRDDEIAYGEGSREMKEFLRQKEELVENLRIDLINSRQKLIDLTKKMSERIDQLTAELVKSKARRLRDNKRAAVTHQSFKELVVHEQDKCDGEALHQRQLSALVAFFVEEIKFLQVERDLMQGCFFGRTCVCKLDISSIDPIGVMDRGIGTTTAEKIARGREIVVKRSPEYMASRTEIGGSSSAVSPTPTVGGRSTDLPSRKSSKIKK